MFTGRYFSGRYFARRYWPGPPAAVVVLEGERFADRFAVRGVYDFTMSAHGVYDVSMNIRGVA